MKMTTEIVEEQQKALIVSRHNYEFINNLKNRLKKSSATPFFSSRNPKSFDVFDYCFYINEPVSSVKLKDYPNQKFIFIILKNKIKKFDFNDYPNVKIISVNSLNLNENDIDRILWFSFSKSQENYLNIESLSVLKTRPKSQYLRLKLIKYFTKKNLILFFIIALIGTFLSFIPNLMISSFLTYRSFNYLQNEDIDGSKNTLNQADFYLKVTQKLYSFSRPTLMLFSVALYPDTFIDLNARSQSVVKETISIINEGRQIQPLLLNLNKSKEDKIIMKLRLDDLTKSIHSIKDNLDVISQKAPFAKDKLIEADDAANKASKIFDYFKKIITDDSVKKYLVFFANNRELRPGGGFIGSFGVFNVGAYNIGDFKVYDVYDADGQLQAHIEPPIPLKKYLGVPHFFLRDSNFSPDFLDNYNKALFFLEKEMNFTDFQGSVLITTSSIENVLAAFGNIYLPNYNEYINANNFYIKTQLYVEKDFFPGSTQKRNFLSSLINQLFINLDQISFKKLALGIKKSLDEKQMVVYLKDESIQPFFDSSYWSGRVIEPRCTLPQACILDYLFPYDANVGANKTNYYISRDLNLKTTIEVDGTINHTLSIQYKNSSPSDIAPVGYYRDYFQLLLPRDSTLKQVTRDGVLVDNIDQKDDLYKLIGFYFQVAPGQIVEIKINYTLQAKVVTGQQIYQFVIQKQIGAPNSDFILEFKSSPDVSILNQNFSPVVKDQKIIYNTSLSTDKIFLIELMKK